LALVLALTAAPVVSGCRVSESDVHRWEITERGPYKMVAVITHDKYALPLRVEAALSLIRMAPRSGMRQGLKYLVNGYKDEDGVDRNGALVQLGEETRRKIVNGMTPELIRQIQAPPPQRNPDGTILQDPSIPFKDIAFALLSHEPPLISDDVTKRQVVDALTQWAQTDFDNRIENATQQFGLEQMMRFLGKSSVTALPGMVNPDTYRIDRIAGLVSDIGDADTKKRMGEALVATAKKIESPEWVLAQTKVVDDHNKKTAPQLKVTPEQVTAQVGKMQDSKFTEQIFPSMKRVGSRPVSDYLFAYAANPQGNAERRKLAMAALEGNIDKNNKDDADRLFAIARNDETPDGVRDLTFARLGELPKDQIVPRLYADPAFFSPKKWKVRWVAASLVLKTMGPRDIQKFMEHLPKTPNVKMGMTEPLSYGGLMAKMDVPTGEPNPRDIILGYLSSKDFGAKMTALGFFYDGKKSDIATVKSHEEDATPLPKCDKEDDCGWTYEAPKAGGQPGEKEQRDLKNIGDFVRNELVPSMTK
jgi:hypothetical protein